MMHAASGAKGRHRRLMYRTTIKGDVELGRVLDPADAKAAAERMAVLAGA